MRSGRGVLLEASGWGDTDQGADTDTKLRVNPKVQVCQVDQVDQVDHMAHAGG